MPDVLALTWQSTRTLKLERRGVGVEKHLLTEPHRAARDRIRFIEKPEGDVALIVLTARKNLSDVLWS